MSHTDTKTSQLKTDSVSERTEGIRGDKNPRWYVVHTYSGHENKVKINIEKMVENRGMQDLILSVVVPMEEVAEPKKGRMQIRERKIFPGYVIVKMIITNESWYLVRNTEGVTGFVGHGTNPIPLSNDEVRSAGIEKIHVDLKLKPGDKIKVIGGPFENLMGVVEEVNKEREQVKAKVDMFGRKTLAELEFAHIEKLK